MHIEDWKTFLIRHKWIPTSILREKFDLNKYDVDNFKRKPQVRHLVDPWKISKKQSADRLTQIFKEAWMYYLTEVVCINIKLDKKEYVSNLISLKNISQRTGFSFLTNSAYLDIACPVALSNYRAHGFTNIALGLFQFWPGEQKLLQNGVLPFMFYQTHTNVLDRISIDDMVEHVYLNFLSTDESDDISFAKEVFYARFDESGFITADKLAKYSVPYNFYKNEPGGLKSVLNRIKHKFSLEIGEISNSDSHWSSSRFRRQYTDKILDRCRYCDLSPVDLHHLLPRNEYPEFSYHPENVVPLCLQIHGLISRKRLNDKLNLEYQKAISRWKKVNESEKANSFENIMNDIHEFVYGRIRKA